MTIAIPIIIESSTTLSDIIISGVGSGGVPGAGAPPLIQSRTRGLTQADLLEGTNRPGNEATARRL